MTRTQKTNRVWKWICAGFILIALYYLSRPNNNQKNWESEAATKNRGTVNYVEDDSLEFVYETLPEGRKVKGLVFLAHGCSHSGTDWWDKSDRCRKCIGLPEEKRIVARLIEEDYVPVAVSSQDRLETRCWHEADITPLWKAIKIVREKLNLSTEPLFAFGASSGGTFVSRLGIDPASGFTATAPQLLIESHPKKAHNKASPIFFTYMASYGTRSMYERLVEDYKKNGYNIRAQFIPPLPVIPTFFSDRIEAISPKTSRLMVAALREADLLDESGMLRENPRGSAWRTTLQKFAGTDSLVADESPISEVLNVAYAQHEMSSDFVDDMIDFFKEESLKAGL